MTRKQVHGVYALAFVLAASMTTQLLASVNGGELLGALIQQNSVAIVPTMFDALDRNEAALRRREIQDVLERCNERTAKGEQIDCPDINSEYKTEKFMRETSATHSAAPKAKGVDAARLSTANRAILQRYVDSGRCSQSLRRVLPGLYELCLSLTVDTTTRTLTPREMTIEERREERLMKRLRN